MKYDLEPFTALNEEYRSKRLVRKPPTYAAAVLEKRGSQRVRRLADRFGIAGRRQIEIGRGETRYLYRGLKASHRYRQAFFHWTHLLFTDEVFEQLYTPIRFPPARAACVNVVLVKNP